MTYSLQEALRELRKDYDNLVEDVPNSNNLRIKYHEGNTDYEIIKFNNLRIFGDGWCNKVYNDRTVEFLKDLANNITSDLTVLAMGEARSFEASNGNNNVFIIVISKNLFSDKEINSIGTPQMLIGFSGSSNWFKPSSKIVRDVFMINENNLNDVTIIKTTNMQRYFDPLHYNAYAKYYPEIFELKISSAKDLAKFIDEERKKGYYNKYKLGKSHDYYEPGKNGDLIYDVKMDNDSLNENTNNTQDWQDYAEVIDIEDYLDSYCDDTDETQDQIKDLERQSGIKVVGVLQSDNDELNYRYLGDDNNAYIGSYNRNTNKWHWSSVSLDDLNESLNEEFNDNKINLVIVSEDLLQKLKKSLKDNNCKIVSAYTYFSDIFVFYEGDLNGEFDTNEFNYLSNEFGLDIDDLEEAFEEGKLEAFIIDKINVLEPKFIDIDSEEPSNFKFSIYYILSYYDEENNETYYASDDIDGYTTSEVDAYHFKKYELEDALYNFADDLNVGRSEITIKRVHIDS